MKPIIKNISNEKYHADKAFISGSQLVSINNGQSEADWLLEQFSETKQTKALVFGTTSHTMMLENGEFLRRYAPQPDFSGALDTVAEIKDALKSRAIKFKSSMKKGDLINLLVESDPEIQVKANILARHKSKNTGKEIVSRKDFLLVSAMRDAVMSKKKMADMINNGIAELSIFAEIESIKVKIRPDLIVDHNCIVDYKTTRDCNPEFFADECYKMGYFLKMALQHDVFKMAFGVAPKVYLLPQNKHGTYQNYLMRLSENQLEIGRQQYRSALIQADHILKTGEASDYFDPDQEIELGNSDWINQNHGIDLDGDLEF